ncbi:hypothetical protein PPSIR1_21014 [Plesiocystis pacifica SIR-1]|uniref:Uncharacterized protein n=1 Tax=Plesiocystis pacifica SIR-1 TaxID=391625 RepID=A6G3E2_9BACT|nr:hypothetical protein PPSIR1_21014 [Plesiocystis pacifica SIR-1]
MATPKDATQTDLTHALRDGPESTLLYQVIE